MARLKSHLFSSCGLWELSVSLLCYTTFSGIVIGITLIFIRLLYPSHKIPGTIFSYSVILSIANTITIIISILIVDVVEFFADKLTDKLTMQDYSPYNDYNDLSNPYDWLLDK